MRFLCLVIFCQLWGANSAAASCGLVYGDAPSVAEKLFALNTVAQMPECRTGPGTLSCIWEFDLTADAALGTYAALVGQLRNCGEDVAEDVPVSHPDNSVGWNAVWGEYRVRASKKDKHGLAKTYVFFERRTK